MALATERTEVPGHGLSRPPPGSLAGASRQPLPPSLRSVGPKGSPQELPSAPGHARSSFSSSRLPTAKCSWGEPSGRSSAETVPGIGGPGVGGGMHGLQRPDRHVGVDLGAGQLGVAEHGLDVADVGAAFEHQGGHGVAEDMARTGLGDPRALHVTPCHLAQVHRRQPGPVGGQEQGAIVGGDDEGGRTSAR